METVEAILVLMAGCVGFALLARWARLPCAVLLVPRVPQATLRPGAMLGHIEGRHPDPSHGGIAADLRPGYHDRARVLAHAAGPAAAEPTARQLRHLAALPAGRETLIEHHRRSRRSDGALVAVEHEPGLEELRVCRRLGPGSAS